MKTLITTIAAGLAVIIIGGWFFFCALLETVFLGKATLDQGLDEDAP